MGPPPTFDTTGRQAIKAGFGAGLLGQNNPMQLVQPAQVAAMQRNAAGNDGMNPCRSPYLC
jgi:hypothetical protein